MDVHERLWFQSDRFGWQAVQTDFDRRHGSFSGDFRVAVPVRPEEPYQFDEDWISSIRTTWKTSWRPSKAVELTWRYRGDWHLMKRGGYMWGIRAYASRQFQNELRTTATFTLMPGVTLALPVVMRQSKYAHYQPGARFSDRWRYALWIDPELTYTFDNGAYLSVVYESDTFVSGDLSKVYFTESLESFSVTLWAGIPL